MWFIYALLSAFGAALIAILVKIGLKATHVITLSVIFYAVQFLFLLIASLFFKKIDAVTLSAITRQEWLYIILIGSISSLAYLSYLFALQQGRACSVVAVDRLAVLFVVVLSALFLSQPLTIKSVTGALLMLGGAFLLTC